MKIAYGIVIALLCYYAFGQLESPQDRPAFAAAYGLVPAVVLSLLLVSAQAVTSITSERDGKSLDLLLVTDISPKEFVFGKLGGVLYNTKEFIIPPLLMATYYAVAGALAYTQMDEIAFLRNLGPLLCVLGSILILIAFVMILGLHVALRIENSRLVDREHLGNGVLPVGRCARQHLLDRHQWRQPRESIAELYARSSVWASAGLWWVLERGPPGAGINTFGCSLSARHVLLSGEHPDRQARLARIVRSAAAVPGDRGCVRLHDVSDARSAFE